MLQAESIETFVRSPRKSAEGIFLSLGYKVEI